MTSLYLRHRGGLEMRCGEEWRRSFYQSCEKWKSVTSRQGKKKYSTYNKMKEGWLDWLQLS